jgi:hypothetical protein
MGDTITGIQHDTGGLAATIQGKNALNGDEQRRYSIFVEENID